MSSGSHDRRPSVSFLPGRERENRFLLIIIGIMVFLAALVGGAGLSLYNATSSWSRDLSRALTVQIVTDDSLARERETQLALQTLRTTPGVARAEALSRQELVTLLEPWLGAGNVSTDLPIPAMIAVTLEEGIQIDAAALEARLVETAPAARLDDHQKWIGDVLALGRLVQGAAVVSFALIVLTTIAIVIFACRAALAVHQDTVAIVHALGAHDSRIAGEFRSLFMRLGLVGAMLGLALAGVTLIAFAYLTNRLGGGLLPQARLTSTQGVYFLLLPFLTATLTMITADLTVRKALRKLV